MLNEILIEYKTNRISLGLNFRLTTTPSCIYFKYFFLIFNKIYANIKKKL